MATLPTTVRNDALALSTDLAQAGAVFNDATRLLDGGLWNNPADSNNQIAYLGMYTTDIQAVLNDVNGDACQSGRRHRRRHHTRTERSPIRRCSRRCRASCRR